MPPCSPSVLIVYLGFTDNSEKEKTSPGSRLLPINPSKRTFDLLIVFSPALGVVQSIEADLAILKISESDAVIKFRPFFLKCSILNCLYELELTFLQ